MVKFHFNPAFIVLAVFSLPIISGCQENDLQGYNPQEYYTANPIENKVEARHSLLTAEFEGKSNKLSDANLKIISESLSKINPNAVEAVKIILPATTKYKKNKVDYIKNILSSSGLNKPVDVVYDAVEADEIIIDVTYNAVILPDCPDWKKSPVTTYSNSVMANFGCASAVNFGLMIDNPKDLVSGRDSREVYSARGSKVLTDYHSGVDPAVTNSASASTPTGQ